jgi:hypothetical protein
VAEAEPGPLDAFLPLTAAESAIAAAMAAGQADGSRDRGRPEQHETERAVRAEVLRILLLDADPRYPSHEKGLRLTGAIITGLLDLEGCRIPRDIQLRRCRFETAPVLRSAIIDNLFLDGSLLPGLRAEGMQARGVLSLREAEIVGTVQLTGSRLGGYLNADRATLNAANGIALEAGGIETGGSLLLREAHCTGSVNFSGCRIGGDVSLAGGRFVRPGGLAVNGDGATMRGDILLRAARIEGETRLCGAQVGGNVDCSGCRLENSPGDALSLNRARVQGVFFLQNSAVIRGRLDLTASVIGAIHDEPDSWPQEGQLSLNRCRYGAIIHGPVDARSRLDWLSRQIPAVWPEFLPQPYEQLATVLREMGHQDDARTVMVEKERLQRLARRQRTKAPLLKFTYFVSDWVLALTVRYGHQPLYAFIWLLCFWVAGALVFEAAAHTGALQPNAPVMLRSLEWTMCAVETDETRYMPTLGETLPGRAAIGQSQFDCFRQQPEAQSYPPFHPWMYSLDTLLPVTSLGQREFWRPSPETGIGVFALNYYYLQSVIGWSLSLLAVAGFSGIVKSR